MSYYLFDKNRRKVLAECNTLPDLDQAGIWAELYALGFDGPTDLEADEAEDWLHILKYRKENI